MAVSRPTSTDILAINNSEEVIGVIEETRTKYPEWDTFAANPIDKTSYYTLVQTALPSTGFRTVNTGREHQKATIAARQVTCKLFDASWAIDQGAVKESDWSEDKVLAWMQSSHLDSAMKSVCDQIWYGTDADSGGFAGVASILDDSDDDYVVDAGGDEAKGCSSVFAVRFGPAAVSLCWGGDAKLDIGGIVEGEVDDSDGNPFWAYKQKQLGWCGLQITDYTSMGRICNIDESSGHTLTDDLISDLIAEFKVGQKPDAFYCSRRSLKQLQQSRTATNPTGQPAPFPDSAFGIPLYASDSVLNTETPLTAGS